MVALCVSFEVGTQFSRRHDNACPAEGSYSFASPVSERLSKVYIHKTKAPGSLRCAYVSWHFLYFPFVPDGPIPHLSDPPYWLRMI
jgi:hypothetical protein